MEVLKRNYADSQEELARLQAKHQELLDKSKREHGQLEDGRQIQEEVVGFVQLNPGKASSAVEKHRLEDELKDGGLMLICCHNCCRMACPNGPIVIYLESLEIVA